MAALPPLPQPIGIFTRYIARQTEVLIVDEKGLSFSGDSFRVNLASGAPVFNVKGNAFSMRGRKQVFDLQDNHLFTIRKRAMTFLHEKYVAESPAEEVLMDVKFSAAKCTLPTSFHLGAFEDIKLTCFPSVVGSKAYVTFTSASGKAESLSMEGDWRTKRAEITDDATGATVARVERQSTAKHYLGNAQTYTVTVAPNMDMALVMAMCVCLDEKKESGAGASAGASM